MADVKEFKLEITQAQIDALLEKLRVSTLPDELEESAWDLGSPLSDITRLKQYWETQFDFSKFQQQVNELPQFVTPVNVEGYGALDIHFVWQKSQIKNAIPLLFVHGWPGSFIEVSKLLPLLAQGDGVNKPAFEIVAPSLPNFGFSEGVKQRGFDLSKYAEALNQLMLKLGYNEYVTQGGDWGYMITRIMSLKYPKNVKACHINMARPPTPPKFLENPLLAIKHALTPYSQLDKQGLARGRWFAAEGSGYNLEQRTKPQTLGYALADSPVALLAWIYEKLHDWTDNYPWTDDEILTWISIYHFSRAGSWASVRIYREASHPTHGIPHTRAGGYIPHVPLGIARFPQELAGAPSSWNATMAPKVYQSDNSKGGHFAATENPEAIVHDLNVMLSPGGIAHKAVQGRSGFQKFGANL